MYDVIDQIVRNAGAMILNAGSIADSVAEKTSPSDLVTEYDVKVQAYLKSELLAAFPDVGFYGEEEKTHDIAGKHRVFVVDPIDGTTNFIRQMNYSCVSVALTQDNVTQYAVVYNPFTDEFFSAQLGHGSFLNGRRLKITSNDMRHSIVCIGSAIYYRDTLDTTTALFGQLLPICQDVRRGGSAALDLCSIACGRMDLYFECLLQPWDYAAASLIVTEAGGVCSALDGKPLRLDRQCSVAVGTPSNHPALLQAAQKASEVSGYTYIS